MWVLVAGAGLAVGGVAHFAGAPALRDGAWALAVVVALVPITRDVVRSLVRREPGVDAIALLAMVGALALRELLAGAVIALMYTGGQYLEHRASRRANRELTALLERAPRVAHRLTPGGVESVDVDEVRPADRLVVRSGEVVPVDGVVTSAAAVLDESALTGEAKPVERMAGDRVSSGVVNASGPFELRAVSAAEDSTYAGIVRLVDEAQRSRAPFVRLADRYAGVFLPVTLVVAAGAWLWSGDPVRALAVLVVATPCPLILAAPIAITSGVSRAARRGVIVKGGAALEGLANSRTVLFDKTGTLTTGRPHVAGIDVWASMEPDELVRLAGSLEQASAHVFAPSIVDAARARRLALEFPTDVEERDGVGITGMVGERRVTLGKPTYVAPGPLPEAARASRRRAALEGSSPVFVAVDGRLAGAILLDDPLRPDAPRVIRELSRSGITRTAMVTGDAADIAEIVGRAVGVDQVFAERSPEDKIAAVTDAGDPGRTLMIGDGVNDAPALAAADVGVAMGARGATASSEAADVVLALDRLDRLVEARNIAVRSQRIAVQSVVAGMAMSFVAMGFAFAGLLAPVAGAIVQEGIDLAVIANALRALRGPRRAPDRRQVGDLSARFMAEHRELVPQIDRIRLVADRLETLADDDAMAELLRLRSFLVDRLVPHELEEERVAYPLLAAALDGADPTGPLIGAHREILRVVSLYDRLLDEIGTQALTTADRLEIRRLLYGLHAVLRLHFAQEEESYFAVGAEAPTSPVSR